MRRIHQSSARKRTPPACMDACTPAAAQRRSSFRHSRGDGKRHVRGGGLTGKSGQTRLDATHFCLRGTRRFISVRGGARSFLTCSSVLFQCPPSSGCVWWCSCFLFFVSRAEEGRPYTVPPPPAAFLMFFLPTCFVFVLVECSDDAVVSCSEHVSADSCYKRWCRGEGILWYFRPREQDSRVVMRRAMPPRDWALLPRNSGAK